MTPLSLLRDVGADRTVRRHHREVHRRRCHGRLGAPVATEDDAELAVRAGLDLVAAVTALGQEIGEPDLRARAGILTGEAAVTIGADGQGMVAGDLVNTASRIQSAAPPGAVFVGDSTRRASDAGDRLRGCGEPRAQGKRSRCRSGGLCACSRGWAARSVRPASNRRSSGASASSA